MKEEPNVADGNGIDDSIKEILNFEWPGDVSSMEQKLKHLLFLYQDCESDKTHAVATLQSTLNQNKADSLEIESLLRRLSSAIDQFENGENSCVDGNVANGRDGPSLSADIKTKIDNVISQQMTDLISENNCLQRTIARMLSQPGGPSMVSTPPISMHSEVAALQAELVSSNERYCKLLSRYSKEKTALESTIAHLESSKRREVWQLTQELNDARSQVESLRASLDALKIQNAHLLSVAKGESLK